MSWKFRNIRNVMSGKALFLYGKLRPINYATAYCKLHKCYLTKRDVKQKNCKNCKHRIEV